MNVRYHLQNRLETYRQFTYICIAALFVAGLLTTWIVIHAYQQVQNAQRHTYVYSRNGAAIHVFSND